MDYTKKKDNAISIFILLLTVSLIFLVTRPFFLSFYHSSPLLGGFVKFFLLASIGDFIAKSLLVLFIGLQLTNKILAIKEAVKNFEFI